MNLRESCYQNSVCFNAGLFVVLCWRGFGWVLISTSFNLCLSSSWIVYLPTILTWPANLCGIHMIEVQIQKSVAMSTQGGVLLPLLFNISLRDIIPRSEFDLLCWRLHHIIYTWHRIPKANSFEHGWLNENPFLLISLARSSAILWTREECN